MTPSGTLRQRAGRRPNRAHDLVAAVPQAEVQLGGRAGDHVASADRSAGRPRSPSTRGRRATSTPRRRRSARQRQHERLVDGDLRPATRHEPARPARRSPSTASSTSIGHAAAAHSSPPSACRPERRGERVDGVDRRLVRLPAGPEPARRRGVLEEHHRLQIVRQRCAARRAAPSTPARKYAGEVGLLVVDLRLVALERLARQVPGRPAVHHRLVGDELARRPRRRRRDGRVEPGRLGQLDQRRRRRLDDLQVAFERSATCARATPASRRTPPAGAGCGTRRRRRRGWRTRRRSSRRCSSTTAARGSASTRGGPCGASP